MSAQPKPQTASRPFHLGADGGEGLATYPLIRAVYIDRVDEARAILKADPKQINSLDPFAGLTPLHIAIFRQSEEMVGLLSAHPQCNFSLKDNFGRTASDMLIYTKNQAIFDLTIR
jgi:ankyrin repeat protein